MANGSVLPNPVPTAAWGLHLGDMNLALGNLTTIAHKQVVAYEKRAASRRTASNAGLGE